MKALRQRKLRCFMVLNVIIFSSLNVVWLYAILFKKSNIIAKDPNNSQRQMTLPSETKEALSLKVTALTQSRPIKQDSLLHKTYLTSRKQCSSKVCLLIMVLSSPNNFNRRSGIRKTWATDHSLMSKWKTVFLIGQVLGDDVLNKYLDDEEKKHGDLIRGEFKDAYRNLTYKTQMGLEWASKYCDFQFLLKTDDDVFVNPYKLIDFLEKPATPKTKFYTGNCQFSATPLRDGKYAVSWEEYNKTKYPDFCNGPAYVLSSDLIPKLVDLFDVSKKPMPLEDVYIGSLLEIIGGVKVISNGLFSAINPANCGHYGGVFTYHMANTPHCMEQLFNLMMKERGK